MSTPSRPAPQPPYRPESPALVLGAIAAVVAAVIAIWLYFPVRSGGAARGPSFAAPVAGFRTEAWFLPDEELLGFVEIPAGQFLMGSDKTLDPLAFDNERWSPAVPQGRVDLPTYYIGRYEVTVAQFRAFAEATARTLDPQLQGQAANHPVTFVTWPDAIAYGRWLEDRLRSWPQTPAPLARTLKEGWRITLPNEAEWEKAARGSDGRIYPWGNQPRPDRVNYRGEAPRPVGSFKCPECPFGLLDMSGNVWEWTRSPYQPYPFDPADDDKTLDADALWVMRGGHFGDAEQNIRAAIRGGADPGVRRPFLGFRLVITKP